MVGVVTTLVVLLLVCIRFRKECHSVVSWALKWLFNKKVLTSESIYEAGSISGDLLGAQVIQIPRPFSFSSDNTILRVVVISDTHGYEDQFVNFCKGRTGAIKEGGMEFAKLPNADVLIHAGDFMGSETNYLDAFLAAQTHIGRKFVVMGNHDSKHYVFELSKATYVKSRTTVILKDGTTIDLRPFQRDKRFREPLLEDRCDFLVSHEPPFQVLDKTFRGERVGSKELRRILDKSEAKPLVHICGHIHGSRGAAVRKFRHAQRPTVVVNASNANSGQARRISYGPIVIELI